MKKIIILGGNPETAVLVDVANTMGYYTIVIDPNPNAPAKKGGAETYDIDGFDIDGIARVAIDKKVDAILVGVADILVKPYKEVCDKLGMHCYATTEAIEAFSSKDGFKRYCLDYDISDIPGAYIDSNSTIEKPKGIDFPIMIKPVDSGGGVGMKICRDETDYQESVKEALTYSKKGIVMVEKYMDCEDMAAYYTFKDGVPYLSATYDRKTTKQQGNASPVSIGAVYPSKHSELFLKKVHPGLCNLFKGLKIKNGVLNLQFFVENGEFYAYDPGFRLQGEAPHILLNHFHGFDHRKMLIDFAFTGVFGADDFATKNDHLLNGKVACTIWVLLKSGTIKSIEGLDTIKSDNSVVFVLERFKENDFVKNEWLGTERQVFSRIYLAEDSILGLNKKIQKFKNSLKVMDAYGNDMILTWIKPLEENYYS